MQIKFNLEQWEYKTIPAGDRVLEITKAECTPSGKPNKMTVTFKDGETGATNQSKYDFDNDKGMFAMAMLCQKALEIPDMDTFDTKDASLLVGKLLLCEVVHVEGTKPKEDGTFPVFANVRKVKELVGIANNAEENAEKIDSITESPRANLGSDL